MLKVGLLEVSGYVGLPVDRRRRSEVTPPFNVSSSDSHKSVTVGAKMAVWVHAKPYLFPHSLLRLLESPIYRFYRENPLLTCVRACVCVCVYVCFCDNRYPKW